jgi:hypothetical protein
MFTDPLGTGGLPDFFGESVYKNIDFFNGHLNEDRGGIFVSLLF